MKISARNGQRGCFVEDAAALYLPPVFRFRNTKRLSERCGFLRVAGNETEENRARTGACTPCSRLRCSSATAAVGAGSSPLRCPWVSLALRGPACGLAFGAGVDPSPLGFRTRRIRSASMRFLWEQLCTCRRGRRRGTAGLRRRRVPWLRRAGGEERVLPGLGSGGGAIPWRGGSCFSLLVF